MASDIVQTIKVEVEGGDEAAAQLEKIGEGASKSFDETAKAAETAGVSVEEFGKLSEKTQEAYVELSKRVTDGSKEIVRSTQDVAQAAAGGAGTKELGAGLDEVSEKSGLTSRQMRSLGKIMSALGAGEAAGMAIGFSKVASSLGALGAAALAFAVAGGAFVKFATDAATAAKGMEDLAKATGESAASLKLQEAAFKTAGVAAEQYRQGLTGLIVEVVGAGAKADDLIAKSAETAVRAKAALDKLKADQGIQAQQLVLTTRQLELQSVQLRLQGAQLAQNLATVREQLSSLDLMQSLETKRANLTVLDAEANLRLLVLKRDLLNNRISQEQYDQKVAVEERAALDRSIEKAEIEVKAAKEERAGLGEKQEAQRRSLQLQEAQVQLAIAQLPIQQAQLRLQYEQNQLAREQFEKLRGLDLADAQRRANEAAANSLGPLIEQLDRLKNGSKEAINPLTTIESLGRALSIALGRAGISAEDMARGFNAANVESARFYPVIAQIYDTLTGLQRLQFDQVLRGLKLDEATIALLRQGSEELKRLNQEAIQTAPVRQSLEDAGKGFVALGKGLKDFRDSAAASVWENIKDAWNDVKALGEAIKGAFGAVTNLVTTPAPNAWQWMVDTFDAALAKMKQSWDEFQRSIQPVSGGGGGGGGGSGFAGGGLLGGRGTGTSDSNLAWVSRGEYITPARAVSQPGVLQFLEALRRSGGNLRAVLDDMGRFAVGGLVLSMPKMPALGGGGMHAVTINFPGLPEITGLRASSHVVEQLQQAASLAQVRSGGRKPSRYG